MPQAVLVVGVGHRATCIDPHALARRHVGGIHGRVQARLAEPLYTLVYVKDFRWEKREKGWTSVWCPLGEGMVNKKFFTTLAASPYAGPICQHHEYELGKTPAEQRAHYKRDLETLRGWLAAL